MDAVDKYLFLYAVHVSMYISNQCLYTVVNWIQMSTVFCRVRVFRSTWYMAVSFMQSFSWPQNYQKHHNDPEKQHPCPHHLGVPLQRSAVLNNDFGEGFFHGLTLDQALHSWICIEKALDWARVSFHCVVIGCGDEYATRAVGISTSYKLQHL